jgi:hypothetical protein
VGKYLVVEGSLGTFEDREGLPEELAVCIVEVPLKERNDLIRYLNSEEWKERRTCSWSSWRELLTRAILALIKPQ